MSAQSREREAFEAWWRASKYCQVVAPKKGWDQIAFDGWQAARASDAALVRQMRDALTKMCRSFPTDTDMQELRWEPSLINEACDAYDIGRAAITAANARLQEDSNEPR